jgi:hypothetical protein
MGRKAKPIPIEPSGPSAVGDFIAINFTSVDFLVG